MDDSEFNSLRARLYNFRRAGRFAEALETAYQLRESARALDGEYHAEADLAWAEAQQKIEPTDKRIGQIANAVMRAYEDCGDLSGILRCWILLGLQAQQSGEVDAAEGYYRKVLLTAEKQHKSIDSPEYEIAALINLAILLDKTGRVEEARDVFRQALAREQRYPSEYIRMIILLNLAGLHDTAGDTTSALDCINEVLRLADRAEDFSTQNHAHRTVGDIFTNLGDIEKGLQHYRAALQGARDSGDLAAIANSLSAIAYILATEQDDPQAALSLAREAVTIAREVSDPDAEATALRVTATALVHRGDDEAGIRYFRDALDIARKTKNHGLKLNLNSQLGAIALRTGNPQEALGYYEVARRIAFTLGNLDLKGRAVLSIASCHLHLGNGSEAYETLVDAINLFEAYRESLYDEDLSQRVRGFLMNAYSMMILFLHLFPGDPDPLTSAELFEVADRMKSRLILDRFHRLPRTPSDDVPKSLIKRERELRTEFLALADSPAARHPDGLSAEMAKLEENLSELMAEIKQYDKNYAESSQEPVVSVDRVREHFLTRYPGTALAQYFVSEDASFIVLLGPGSEISYYQLDITPDEIATNIAIMRRTFNGDPGLSIPIPPLPPNRPWLRPTDSFLGMGAKLIPFVDVLPDIDTLIVIPHEDLHAIPWAALQVGNESLLDRVAVCVAPSASILLQCERVSLQKLNTVSERALLLAVPSLQDGPIARFIQDEQWLPEVLTIPIEEPSLSVPFREWLLNKLTTAGIVHLSCHGIGHMDEPMDAGLLVGDGQKLPDLTDSNREDTVLTAREIAGLQMRARLVVARACRSGEVRSKLGDEIHGLNRAFLYAGAPAVISALWNNSISSSRLLLEEFYRAFTNGATAVQALRIAQQSLRDGTVTTGVWREEWRHPFHWAAFQLLGFPATEWSIKSELASHKTDNS